MQTGLQELRTICKPLALCVAFEKPADQDRLACIWLLALELNKAVLLPSEPMLRLIRLQWWYDALSTQQAQTAPLMQDLQTLIARGDLQKDWLLRLIGFWQEAADGDDTAIQLTDCWSALLVMIAGGGTGDNNHSNHDLGHHLFLVLQGQPSKGPEQEGPEQEGPAQDQPPKLNALWVQAASCRSMLRACAYLVRRGASVDLFSDDTLGLRLFGHMLFRRS